VHQQQSCQDDYDHSSSSCRLHFGRWRLDLQCHDGWNLDGQYCLRHLLANGTVAAAEQVAAAAFWGYRSGPPYKKKGGRCISCEAILPRIMTPHSRTTAARDCLVAVAIAL